jgi:glycosyltransferase involved in cell wall biosynthesis
MTHTEGKALLVTSSGLGFGGLERYCGHLATLLQEHGLHVEVIRARTCRTFIARKLGALIQPLGDYMTPAPASAKGFSLVISDGVMAGRIKGPRVFAICHGTRQGLHAALQDGYGLGSRLFAPVGFWAECHSKREKTVIAVSRQVQRELAVFCKVHAVVVENPVNTSVFRPLSKVAVRARWGIPANARVGLFAGRWEPYVKGLDLWSEVVRLTPEIYWIAASSPPENALRSCPLSRVQILAAANDEEIAAAYNAADFAIQLSRYESFSYLLTEALACGVPVFSTPVGMAPELLSNSSCSYFLLPKVPEGGRNGVFADRVAGKIRSVGSRELKEAAEAGRAAVVERLAISRWKRQMSLVFGFQPLASRKTS